MNHHIPFTAELQQRHHYGPRTIGVGMAVMDHRGQDSSTLGAGGR